MAHVIRETRVFDDRRRDDSDIYERTPRSTIAQIVYLLSGIITGLLTIRIVLALLGANASNLFASFIYNITVPLVAPFFGLFNYRVQYGVVRFEFETLVAIIVYALLAWVIVRFLSIGRSDPEV
jgi:hypothetical protein